MWNIKILAAIGILTITSLVGSAIYAYKQGRQSGMQQVQTLWDSERLAIAEAQAEEQMKARQREQALQALVDRQRKEHQNEVRRIVREHAALTDSLRDRPEARAGDGGVPESAGAGTADRVGCTGAQLSRPDATVLVGIARDADQLRVALKACVAHASEIERQLNRTVAAQDSPEK
jgi:hypothetical protein